MGRYLDELYGDRLTHVAGYEVPDVVIGVFGVFKVYYDRTKVLDGNASRRTTADFVNRFAFPGIYGLTDPIADNVVYVGRSINIGQRFRQHVSGDRDTLGTTLRRKKRDWIFTLFEEGRKPGLVVLSDINTTEEEMRFIQALSPIFNSVVKMKPISESRRRYEERRAQAEILRAQKKLEMAERCKRATVALKAGRKRRKGLSLTEYEQACLREAREGWETRTTSSEAPSSFFHARWSKTNP